MEEDPLYYDTSVVETSGPSIERLIAIRFSLYEDGLDENRAKEDIAGLATGRHPLQDIASCIKKGYLNWELRDKKIHYSVNLEKLYSNK